MAVTPATATGSGGGATIQNTFTGETEALTPIQQQVLTKTGTYSNRAEVEAAMAEAERLGAAKGLDVDCVLDMGSNWSGDVVYSSRCSVNGKGQSEAVQLLRPGGFEAAKNHTDAPGWIPLSQRDSWVASAPAAGPLVGSAPPAAGGGGSGSGGGSASGSGSGSSGGGAGSWFDGAVSFVRENTFLSAGLVLSAGLLVAANSGGGRRR